MKDGKPSNKEKQTLRSAQSIIERWLEDNQYTSQYSDGAWYCADVVASHLSTFLAEVDD